MRTARGSQAARLGRCETPAVLDEVMIKGLHVEAMRGAGLHPEHEPHVVFQASTIGALLDGAYEGELAFAELSEHGDHGLGTLDHLDGEMVALDGRFYRADVDGNINEIALEVRTPFGVVVWFEPTLDFELHGPLSYDELTREIDRHLGTGAPSLALRVDGRFDSVRARSVPRQHPPYRPLAEVVADQHVFELADVEGSVVGFRFPDYSQGLEAAGYHLHFISADRTRGGHVLDCALRSGRARVDTSADLHVALPAGVDLAAPDLSDATAAALQSVEREG
jgi:acetolactate decarboxylase